MSRILFDTGPAWAVLNSADQYHERSRIFLRHERGVNSEFWLPRIAFVEVIGHATSTLEKWVDKEHRTDHAKRILSEINRLGLLMIEHTPEDFKSATAWWEKYADWPIDYPDALIAATALRMDHTRIWTYDDTMIRFMEKVAPKVSCLRPRTPR